MVTFISSGKEILDSDSVKTSRRISISESINSIRANRIMSQGSIWVLLKPTLVPDDVISDVCLLRGT